MKTPYVTVPRDVAERFMTAMDTLTNCMGASLDLHNALRADSLKPYAGHCVNGEDGCHCGGDTPRVRASCGNWRTA